MARYHRNSRANKYNHNPHGFVPMDEDFSRPARPAKAKTDAPLPSQAKLAARAAYLALPPEVSFDFLDVEPNFFAGFVHGWAAKAGTPTSAAVSHLVRYTDIHRVARMYANRMGLFEIGRHAYASVTVTATPFLMFDAGFDAGLTAQPMHHDTFTDDALVPDFPPDHAGKNIMNVNHEGLVSNPVEARSSLDGDDDIDSDDMISESIAADDNADEHPQNFLDGLLHDTPTVKVDDPLFAKVKDLSTAEAQHAVGVWRHAHLLTVDSATPLHVDGYLRNAVEQAVLSHTAFGKMTTLAPEDWAAIENHLQQVLGILAENLTAQARNAVDAQLGDLERRLQACIGTEKMQLVSSL